jgi:hypothetical protein
VSVDVCEVGGVGEVAVEKAREEGALSAGWEEGGENVEVWRLLGVW